MRDLEQEARDWQRSAGVLATWAAERLVVRNDVWGLRTREGKSFTAPRLDDRGRVVFTRRHLMDHFAGTSTYGVHASDGRISKHCAADFDNHDDSAETAAANIRAAAALCDAQWTAGAFPIVEDSDGNGGLHNWIFFDRPVPTYDLFHWIDGFRTSLGIEAELFPKQATIAAGGYGNWIRIPGRHHKRRHWSRIAKGRRWLAGEDAVRALLEHPLTPASIVPTAPPPRLATQSESTTVNLPADRAAIIAAYLRKLPHGGLGSDRSKKAFNLGRFLRHLKVEGEEAIAILKSWNAGNAPPINDAKLRETWKNSERYASTPLQLRVTETKHWSKVAGSTARLLDMPRHDGPSLLACVDRVSGR